MRAFPLSLCPPRLLICASDVLVDWFLFWNNYQNFCSPSCKNLLGKEGEATGVLHSSRDAALAFQCLCQALKPRVPTMGKCLILLAVQPGWEHLSMGWGKELAKGCFQVKVSQRLYLSTARSRREQRFILYIFCNLLLLSFAAS